jgi:hypothetical protein
MQATLNVLYKTIKTKKKKERFETILEPLQALLQIAYLSFTPIGTKVTIHNNILYIQPPNYSQSIVRWYNNDTQEDLFYLFNIFYRFKKFYYFLCSGISGNNGNNGNNSSNAIAGVAVKECEHSAKIVNKKLYELLIELAKNGIGNLIRTYGQTEKIHILHTLQMYKNILETDTENTKQNQRLDSYNYELDNLIVSHASHASQDIQKDKLNKKKVKSQQALLDDDNEEENNQDVKDIKDVKDSNTQKNNSKPSDTISTKKIDDVFIRITDIYTQEIYYIIYNTLILMEQNDNAYNTIIEGLNKILEPTNIKIKKWIDENIVF